MYTCVMTATNLIGGSFACSVVWLLVSLFFLKFITFLMQLCKIVFERLEKTPLIPPFPRAVCASAPLFVSTAQLRLSGFISIGQNMRISNVFSSTFSALTS